MIFFFLSLFSFAQAEPGHQAKVEQFFRENAVSSSLLYCRADIAASECRTLIRFQNKETGEQARGFQMAFFAPSKQAVGTELFLPTENGGVFQQYADRSMDGKFLAEVGELLPVEVSASKVRISSWKPAPGIVADLEFTEEEALLVGELKKPDDTYQQIRISYRRFRELAD